MKKTKCIKIRQDKYGRLGNVGMVFFETEEANIAIQDPNETAMEYEPRNKENKKVITDQLCYGCGSKEHEIRKCNKKNSIFVTNSERCKIKEEEMRGIWEGEKRKTTISSK